jgi:hypothetical protein
MRITVDGKDYFVHVRYDVYEDVPVLVPGTGALARALTQVSINDKPAPTHVVGTGACWCSVLDTFVKSKGRYRAFTRALQAMGIPHTQRGVWHTALREAEKNAGQKVNSGKV